MVDAYMFLIVFMFQGKGFAMAGMLRIGIMNPDDSIDSIECAYDGTETTVDMLASAYGEEPRLRALLDQGNLSWVDCVAVRNAFGMDTVRTTSRPAGSPMMHSVDFTEYCMVARPFNMILVPRLGWMCSHGTEPTLRSMFLDVEIG